jgi:hypothetical protein
VNSWTTLLLLDIARGRYIAKRTATEYERLTLWMLAQEASEGERWTTIG